MLCSRSSHDTRHSHACADNAVVGVVAGHREDAAAEGETLEWEANVYYCSDDEGTCSAEALLIEIVLEKQQETASPATTPADEVDVQYTIQLAA
jgi:hypothetical protein